MVYNKYLTFDQMNKVSDMTIIRRLSDSIIEVDGIHCRKDVDGRYYPIMEAIKHVDIFPTLIDGYLENERKELKQKWNKEVDDLLTDLGIDYEYN